MIPSAAKGQTSDDKLSKAGERPSNNLSIGNGSPITPVEKGSIWFAAIPVNLASCSHVASASAMPCGPVPALAFPVLITR